ncbi:secretory lipase domain-containing protein [Trichoderma sp. SZMC 28015]
MVHLYYWLAASLAVSASNLHSINRHRLQLIPPPSNDSFYAVPGNIGTFAPGDIIKHREPPSQISTYGWTPTHVQKAYQILYRTTDSRKNPTAAVLTALIPPDADFNKLVSLQMAEDSATIDCGPSYTMLLSGQQNPLLISNITQLQVLVAEAALVKKWIVIVPDHEGPKGSFTASKMTGHAILDGIRATLQSHHITGIGSNPKIGLWGYSGGGAATEIAMEMQENYAPELEIAGAAMGGLSSLRNASGIFSINKGPSAALIPAALLGLASQHPELQKAIDQSLKPEFRELFYSPLHQCLQASSLMFSYQDILGMFRNESIPGLTVELIKAWNEESQNEASKIKAPLYVYQSVVDHLSSIQGIDALVRDYCNQGFSVHYERANSPNLSHVKYGILGVPGAVSWLQDRLDGKEASRGCFYHTDTTSALDPDMAALYPRNISDALYGIISSSI